MVDETIMPNRSNGFTLIELMVVMAIVGIVTAIAAPSFNSLIESQRAKSAASDLYMSLMRARSEAAKQNANVTLAPKAGSDWASGWQIADPATNAVIDDHAAIAGLEVSGPAGVTYRGSGRLTGTTAPTFSVSGNFPGSARCVSVDLSGRPVVKPGAC